MRFRYLALVAALLGTAHADDRMTARIKVIDAINGRDVRTLDGLIGYPLRVERVRLETEACRRFWGVSVLVKSNDLKALVECLGSQKVTGLSSPDPNVNAIFGPGFPLDIAFNADGKLIALRSWSEPGSKPLKIERTTFASHVTGFAREIAASKETQKALDAKGVKSVSADLSLCVEGDGSVVPVVIVTDQTLKSYEQDVAEAARGWKIQPFKLDGKPQLACATFTVGTLPQAPEQAIKVSGANDVAPSTLEVLRIRGNTVIVPDDATKKKIGETSARRVIGSFKLCLDNTGTVKSVTVLKPSGYDAYDQKIRREMNTWAYKPYVVNGSPVPVCTAITFVYSVK